MDVFFDGVNNHTAIIKNLDNVVENTQIHVNS